ncbi:hypothetical protein ACIBQX_31515 [Nonomuraea sp. NPDC049714]|uniref:hypothetical protein n=1 Tax=Nonomuraea sp. NPDC049714 TaxID=3364357 RepID=UPI0037BD1A95
MVVNNGTGQSGIGWDGWTNLSLIRARLDAGADPHPAGTSTYGRYMPPLNGVHPRWCAAF